MIFNEIECHVNNSLGLVGGDSSPASPSCVRAWLQHAWITVYSQEFWS